MLLDVMQNAVDCPHGIAVVKLSWPQVLFDSSIYIKLKVCLSVCPL